MWTHLSCNIDALTTSKVPAVPHNTEKAQRAITNGNIRKGSLLDSTYTEESQAENFTLLEDLKVT